MLSEAVSGLVTGANRQSQRADRRGGHSRRWTEHVLGNQNNPTAENPVLHFFNRFEFQDGKRKRGGPQFSREKLVNDVKEIQERMEEAALEDNKAVEADPPRPAIHKARCSC